MIAPAASAQVHFGQRDGWLNIANAPRRPHRDNCPFSRELRSQNLGLLDPKAAVLELSVGGRDLVIHQSPGILSSDRSGGTTGAVVWKVTPLFAEWLSSAGNALFGRNGPLGTCAATVLELGCGVSAVVGLLMTPLTTRYILTDQAYVGRLVEMNLTENAQRAKFDGGGTSGVGRKKGKRRKREGRKNEVGSGDNVCFKALDWEMDEVTPALTGSAEVKSFDAVIACDCIYNEALIEPLVSTCAATCRLRSRDNKAVTANGSRNKAAPQLRAPCVCLVAQQLRDSDIFEAWLACFQRIFRVWRIPDSLLSEGLHSATGFVVHVGVLKDAFDESATG